MAIYAGSPQSGGARPICASIDGAGDGSGDLRILHSCGLQLYVWENTLLIPLVAIFDGIDPLYDQPSIVLAVTPLTLS